MSREQNEDTLRTGVAQAESQPAGTASSRWWVHVGLSVQMLNNQRFLAAHRPCTVCKAVLNLLLLTLLLSVASAAGFLMSCKKGW